MSFVIYTIGLAFDIYLGIIFLQIAISWLINFDVINAGNAQARNLIALLHRATDPIYKRLRPYIPPLGGFDFTPVVLIIGLSLARSIIIGALV